MECEMCGRNISNPVKARIEGTVLSVCNNCSTLGEKVEWRAELPDRKKITLDTKAINPEFAKLVKSARKYAGLTIDHLAEKIGEKASVVERVEKGMRPTDELGKKLEKSLNIKLFGMEEVTIETKKRDSSQALGEVAVIKVKKKS